MDQLHRTQAYDQRALHRSTRRKSVKDGPFVTPTVETFFDTPNTILSITINP